MQPLQAATVDPAAPDRCAEELLLAVPAVMRFIRSQMRSHRKHSLSVPQFRALVFASVNRDPSLSALAEHIGISLPTASRMVDLLVRRGLMERRAAAADRRRVSLSLTARGQAVFRSARRATRAALAQRFRSMTPDERSQTCAALQTLSRVFGGPASAGRGGLKQRTTERRR